MNEQRPRSPGFEWLCLGLFAATACGGAPPRPDAVSPASGPKEAGPAAVGAATLATPAFAQGPEPSTDIPLAPCGSQKWLRAQPEQTDELIFGAGQGRTLSAAEAHAKTKARESIAVYIRQLEADRQTVRTTRMGAGPAKEQADQVYEVDSKTLIEGRLELCHTEESCEDHGAVHALVRCARRSELDRELRKMGGTLAKLVPRKSKIVILPGTTDDGFETDLGKYASTVVEESMTRDLPSDVTLCDPHEMDQLASIHDLRRKHKVKCAIQMEHFPGNDSHGVRFKTRLIDLESGQAVAGTRNLYFDASLGANDGEMLRKRGRLFRNKLAMDLEVNRSGRQADVRVKKNLMEGEAVEIEFNLPRESYVYIFDIYEDGTAVMLLPNPVISENLFKPGKYRIPDKTWQKNDLMVTACPAGGAAESREAVKIVTSPVRLGLDAANFSDRNMVTLQGGPGGNLRRLNEQLDEYVTQGIAIAEGTAAYTITATPNRPSPCRQ